MNKKFLNKTAAGASLDNYEFNQVLYTGNSPASNKSITGVGFKPDLVWVKSRTTAQNHIQSDAVTDDGTSNSLPILIPNTNERQYTGSEAAGLYIRSLDSDGFSTGTSNQTGKANDDFAAWCWKASNSTETNNNGGKQSTVSASNGFSLIKYTASSGGTQTVGHGMTSSPEMIIQKRTDADEDWYIYVAPGIIDGTSTYYYLMFNTNAKATTSDTAPTSTTFNPVSTTGDYVAYAFHSVSGKSKVGAYTVANSSSDTVVTTGFAVNWLIIKRTDTAGTSWLLVDGARDTSNPITCYFSINSNHQEFCGGGNDLDFESTGFRINSSATWSGMNATGGVYFYFAQLAS